MLRMSYINSERAFFGRQDILELFKRRIVDLKKGYRQNIALLGRRYVGKSTLLHHLIKNADDKDIVTIYLDLENKDINYFIDKFIGGLLYEYSKCMNLVLFEDVSALISNTRRHIPQTVSVIDKILVNRTGNNLAECYLGILTLPEIFTNETQKYCVFILDEFQLLEELGVPNVFQSLGNKIMTQKRCFYILSSSFPSLAERIISEKLSLLFGNFETVILDVFDGRTSQEFIAYSLKEYRIGLNLSNFLIHFSNGHPLYLNLLCQELKNLSAVHNQEEIYMPLLSQAVENTIFDRWGVLSRHFEIIISELCSGKGDKIMAVILLRLSNKKYKLLDIVEFLRISRAQVNQKIQRLIDLGIVSKNGIYYYIHDNLFKYWLKFVYKRRVQDIELTFDKQRKKFKEEFSRLSEGYNSVLRVDLSTRIVELLYCFDNEAFNLNGRKYKLPTFRTIEPIEVEGKDGHLLNIMEAKTDSSSWCIVMKKDSFIEKDIGFVANNFKRGYKKFERHLIISLLDLDNNTRIKALQERFWIWNTGEINTLLTLFEKPYIVR